MLQIADKPGCITVEAMRQHFENQIRNTPAFAQNTPLSVITVNGAFSHYADPDTDTMWLGYAMGMRRQDRIARTSATEAAGSGETSNSTPKIQLTTTVDQAAAACKALDLFSRLCSGQLEELATMVRIGEIPMGARDGKGERQLASPEVCDQIEAMVKGIKALLGYPANGHAGIGHPHISLSGRRAWEVQKVLARTVAEITQPGAKGVNHDGLLLRYTEDPEPTAKAM